MNIIDNITSINYENGLNRKIEYIVVHYTADKNDTALGNTKYFKDVLRNASAHYFVDENNIYRCVKDEDISWHCGANKYVHNECRNSNSIGIEMCNSINYNEKVENNTIELVRELMKKYNIPKKNILRHYDITGKACPVFYVDNVDKWKLFKDKVMNEQMTLDEANKIIKDKTQLSDYAMQYLNMFKYDESLLTKLAKAMK